MKNKFTNKFKVTFKKREDEKIRSILLMIEYKNHMNNAIKFYKNKLENKI